MRTLLITGGTNSDRGINYNFRLQNTGMAKNKRSALKNEFCEFKGMAGSK